MWGRKPDDGKNRLITVFMLTEESKCIIHCDDGPLALPVLYYSVSAQVGIVVEKIQSNHPFIKTHARWVAWRVRLPRTQMHFTEDPRDVATCLQRFRKGLLVRTHVAAVIGHFRPDGVASSHDTGTGG